MSAETRVEWFGTMRVDQPIKHQLRIDPQFATPATHTCTGCTWTVDTYTPLTDQATLDAIRKAFAQHLTPGTTEAVA